MRPAHVAAFHKELAQELRNVERTAGWSPSFFSLPPKCFSLSIVAALPKALPDRTGTASHQCLEAPQSQSLLLLHVMGT